MSTLLSLALAVILARRLGPSGYGVYSFVMALIYILSIPAMMGLPQLLVRETAKAHVNNDWGVMRGLWRWSTGFVLLFTAIVTAGTIAIVQLLSTTLPEVKVSVLTIGLFLIPLIALSRIRSAALRGLQYVVIGQLPDNIIRPAVLILLLLTSTLTLFKFNLTPQKAMALHVVAAGCAFTIGAFLLWSLRPLQLAERPLPIYKYSQWLRSIFPLALISGIVIINQNTDLIMLGLLRSDAEVGVYRVVVQGATIVVFGLNAINIVVSPKFARLHSQGNYDRIQSIVTMSARAILALGLPVVIGFIVFGREILSIIFGENYTDGNNALIILSIGQLINAAMGSVGMLLNMTGHEQETLRGLAIAAIFNVLLNIILIPPFGIEGAAIATTITLAIWNVILWRAAKRCLGINSSALYRVSRNS